MESCVRVASIDGNELNLAIAQSSKAFAKGYEKGQLEGIKFGLEVAKKVCEREGYELTFPDPTKIKVEKQ